VKRFNTTTTCIIEDHYMVDISGKLEKIVKLIDGGMYFTINRARQYGKTTTMSQLFHTLKDKYVMIRGSLEGFGSEPYKSEERFAKAFLDMLQSIIRFQDKKLADYIESVNTATSFKELSERITDICMRSEKEIVLMVDEVDKASSNIVFLDLLAMLRDKYIKQRDGLDKTFKSVILAGVHDIKNLKVHIKERRMLTEEEAKMSDKTTYNSPWNVAEDFIVDMSFSPKEISTMLAEYEIDYKTGMNIEEISKEIYNYTNGYPFLVSKICKVIDERLEKNWSKQGIQEAVKIILNETGTLFDDLIKNIEHNENLYNTVYSLAIEGQELTYDVYADEKGLMYGILKKGNNGKLAINNKMFEMLIYNYLSVKKEREGNKKVINYESRSQFIDEEGNLEILNILEKFQELMKEEYREETEKFVEKEGRLIFIAFMRPIINGTGFYYVEAETRTNKRIDIVITYNKKEYIIELKKYYDKPREEKGHKQLAEYLRIKNISKGYMVTFNFNKSKEYTREWIDVDGKRIYEVVV